MTSDEPLHLLEDAETGDRFLVFDGPKGLRLDIRFEGETLWMTQPQVAQLFGVTRQAVNSHLVNIYEEAELDRDSTSKEILQVQTEGARTVSRKMLVHNLDAVISVGYRVSSKQATLFRRWATGVLVQYARKGFVVDAVRIKDEGRTDRIAELREIIRDIRADEANVYRELKRICALCQDYDDKSDAARTFFQQTQAKLIYAVVSQTPSEIINTRADHRSPNMGLQTWPKDNIRKQDATVSKNYLAATEIRELNRLTIILLDIFEDQADLGRIIVMDDATGLLERQLSGLGRVVLKHGGSVAADSAKRYAETEYDAFDAARKIERHADADKTIGELMQVAKNLPKGRRD
jgi:hypothetical protein